VLIDSLGLALYVFRLSTTTIDNHIIQQEAFSRTTRFILICNYVTRIIEPLASRCAKFRFQALPPETMRARLVEICTLEGIHDLRVVDDVLRHSHGDMRKAVTTLQSLSAIPGGGGNNVREIAGTIPDDVVDAVWRSMTTSKRFDVMAAQVEDLVTHAGFSAQTLLTCLLDKLLLDDDDNEANNIIADGNECPKLSEVAKASIAIRLAEAEKNMIEGADEYLQLLTVGSMVFESTTLQHKVLR
jgi:replication factor C subunit 2/4